MFSKRLRHNVRKIIAAKKYHIRIIYGQDHGNRAIWGLHYKYADSYRISGNRIHINCDGKKYIIPLLNITEIEVSRKGPSKIMKKLIYLASPYSHPDPLIEEKRFNAVCVCAANFFRAGEMVFSPIAHTRPIAVAGNLNHGFDSYAEYDKLMIGKCERFMILKLPGWERSIGVRAERKYAETLGRTIEYIEVE